MVRRDVDWLKQGQRDIDHARRALEDGDYEWTCFAAQQGAEKAVKAVYQWAGGVAWGYSVTALLQALPSAMQPDAALLDAARELDRHYIPTRYPDAHPQGAPFEYYTRSDAERAIGHADHIVAFCQNLLARPGEGADKAPGGGEGAG